MDARLKWHDDLSQLARDIRTGLDKVADLVGEWDVIEADPGGHQDTVGAQKWRAHAHALCLRLRMFRNDIKASAALSKQTIPFDGDVLLNVSEALQAWCDDKTELRWEALKTATLRADTELSALHTVIALKQSVSGPKEEPRNTGGAIKRGRSSLISAVTVVSIG